ncbi:MAG: YihY/virulence factor BrkB family protein [Calothrix sp. SM1_5_4]|nr:YihY/virulence factor BrkB family protein [Calothrix sp. SM1_5_4]
MPGFIAKLMDKFAKDQTPTLAASLAFYTALSMAPILILFVAVASKFSDSLQAELLTQARNVVGVDAAKAVEIVIEGAKNRTDLTSAAGILGTLTLLISAGLIFGELRFALNRIFGVEDGPARFDGFLGTVARYLWKHLVQTGFALIVIVSLVVSLAASSVLSSSLRPHASSAALALNVLASLAFYVLIFTAMFHYLPNRRPPWKNSIQGGVLTAPLFVLGKELLGIYLGNSALGSAYGAAGSFILLLVWVYYSSLITFIGAQVSSLLTRGKSCP